ncbi:MAG: GntR family transcriptional regulator, partial [Clostridia bacterium]|nr:GntR family transcriptional regulator [Clostridia bacterium]
EKDGFISTLPAKGCYVAPKNLQLVREENLKKIERHIEQIFTLAKQCDLTLQDLHNMLDFGMEDDR